jgi:hypothetical protein
VKSAPGVALKRSLSDASPSATTKALASIRNQADNAKSKLPPTPHSDHDIPATVDTNKNIKDDTAVVVNSAQAKADRVATRVAAMLVRTSSKASSLSDGGEAGREAGDSQASESEDASRSPRGAIIASGILCILFNILVETIRVTSSTELTTRETVVVDQSADNLLRMACWFACLGYLLQLCAYIAVRMNMKTLQRPSPSPTGIPGVIASLIITVVFGLVGPFFLPDSSIYVVSLVVFVAFAVLFFIYYQIYALPRLTNSPERLFILYVDSPFLSCLMEHSSG